MLRDETYAVCTIHSMFSRHMVEKHAVGLWKLLQSKVGLVLADTAYSV